MCVCVCVCGIFSLWDGKTGKFIATLRGHVGDVYQVCWSADSRMLVSGSKDSTVKVGWAATHSPTTGATEKCQSCAWHGNAFVGVGHLEAHTP